MAVSKTSGHIQIKINILTPSQKPPAPNKAPNQDLKDMDDLCTFKIKEESKNLDYWCPKPMTTSKSRSRCKIQVRNLQHPPNPKIRTSRTCMFFAPSNQDREPNFGTWVYQRPLTISKSRQDAKPKSGTSSILQSPKWGLKGHGCSLHLQNQDREPKFGTWKY